jgi:ubiquinone biosynthesis protein
MSTILIELKDIIIQHGLKVPTHFFLLARSMVTLEGVVHKLDPELDQYDIAKPFLLRAVAKSFSPIRFGEKALNSIYELGNYMEDFPRDLKNAIRKINRGEVKVDLTHKGIDPMVHTVNRITKQIITAFIMAALIIGASMFIVSNIEPLWGNISIIGIVFIAIAIVLAFGMIKDIRKGDHDEWWYMNE